MKKYLLPILLLFILSSSCNSTLKEDFKKFEIGLILPLSGGLSEYGEATKNGIEMALKEKPELFTNINLHFEDSAWESKKAISAFNKLAIKDKASLIYTWGNPTGEAVAVLSERYKLPLLVMGSDPKITKDKNFIIRTICTSEQFAKKLADYINTKDYKKLGFIVAENTYVQGLFIGLKKYLNPSKQISIIDNYNISDQDFRTTVSKIKNSDFDALGVFLISGQISSFYRQLQEQKVSLPSFGTDFFESKTEINFSNGGMNGAVYSHTGISDKFKNTYINKYGNDLQIAYAGQGYDLAILLGKLFNNNPNLEAIEIMKVLKSDWTLNGVSGEISYKNSAETGPYFDVPIRLKKIVDEEYVALP